MARGDSVIRVSIIGDATKLVGAMGQADKATGGLLKSSAKVAVGGLLAAGAVKEIFDFAKDATQEADRLGDAAARLNAQLGPEFAKQIQEASAGFTKIGLSTQDVAEMSANFADLATALGLSDMAIANLAPNVAATAQAMSLLGKGDADTIVEQIGKAAGGSEKAMKALGVTIDDAAVTGAARLTRLADTGREIEGPLTDAELATARLKLIMDQLSPSLATATTGTGDLEQKQAELQARVETLSGQLGGPLSDALSSVLGFIIDEIDAIPGAIEGWKMLGAAIEGFARTVLGPLGNVNDLIGGMGDALNNLNKGIGAAGDAVSGLGSERFVVDSTRRFRQRQGTP